MANWGKNRIFINTLSTFQLFFSAVKITSWERSKIDLAGNYKFVFLSSYLRQRTETVLNNLFDPVVNWTFDRLYPFNQVLFPFLEHSKLKSFIITQPGFWDQ